MTQKLSSDQYIMICEPKSIVYLQILRWKEVKKEMISLVMHTQKQRLRRLLSKKGQHELGLKGKYLSLVKIQRSHLRRNQRKERKRIMKQPKCICQRQEVEGRCHLYLVVCRDLHNQSFQVKHSHHLMQPHVR